MVAPVVAMLGAAAIAAAKGAGDYFSSKKQERAGKRRAKETKRETYANLIENALNRSGELEASQLQGRNKLNKRRSQSLQDTSDLVRGAFNI